MDYRDNPKIKPSNTDTDRRCGEYVRISTGVYTSKPCFQPIDAILHHLVYGVGRDKTPRSNIGLALCKVGLDPVKRWHTRVAHIGIIGANWQGFQGDHLNHYWRRLPAFRRKGHRAMGCVLGARGKRNLSFDTRNRTYRYE